MIKCYNWEENSLYIKDTYGNIFDIPFRGNKTIVRGNSGTGKSLLYNTLKHIKYSKNSTKFNRYDVDNIVLVDEGNIDNISEYDSKFIIIDRGDIIITPKATEIINSDFGKNRYLIFARKHLGIELSPNYYATMTNKNKIFSLEYAFSVKGWF